MSSLLSLEDFNMGNQLFQEARRFVELAKSAPANERQSAMEKAKNALSSAYANSTIAEQSQLHEMQDELDKLQ
jgi:polyhydroxyalkanoate synthesis regulator phasin